MKTVNIKTRNLFTIIAVFFFSLCFTVQAQEYTWARQRSQYLKKQLGLTEQQADQLYEAYVTQEQKKKEIEGSTTGAEQKKAIWQNNQATKNKIASILTPEQHEKLKDLQAEEKARREERQKSGK